MISLVERHTFPEKVYSRHVIIEKNGYKTYDNIMNVFSNMFWYELYKEVPMGDLRIVAEYLAENLFAPLLKEKKWEVFQDAYNPEVFRPVMKIVVGEYVFILSTEVSDIFDFTHIAFQKNSMAYEMLKENMNKVWDNKETTKAYMNKILFVG